MSKSLVTSAMCSDSRDEFKLCKSKTQQIDDVGGDARNTLIHDNENGQCPTESATKVVTDKQNVITP